MARRSRAQRILELPEIPQTLFGSGEIPVSGIDALLQIQAVSPPLGALVAELFAALLGGTLYGDEVAELKLGKKATALYAEGKTLHGQLDRYAYGPPPGSALLHGTWGRGSRASVLATAIVAALVALRKSGRVHDRHRSRNRVASVPDSQCCRL